MTHVLPSSKRKHFNFFISFTHTAGEIAQWVGRLPCMKPTKVKYLASNKPGECSSEPWVSSEYHIAGWDQTLKSKQKNKHHTHVYMYTNT